MRIKVSWDLSRVMPNGFIHYCNVSNKCTQCNNVFSQCSDLKNHRREKHNDVCVCLQVGPTSPPAPLLPPQPSIIHGGCQTSRTRPQIFCLPPKTWDEYVFFLPEIFARFFRLSFLQVLVEYSWMKYGSWESDGLLHIFGWFPNWWKVRQRVWERWVVWARGWVREAAAWFTRWSRASARCRTLPFVANTTTVCVGKSRVLAKLETHNTHTWSFTSALCATPFSVWQNTVDICQSVRRVGSNTRIWEFFPSVD